MIIKTALCYTIKLYQKCLSPMLGNNCRFYPSCSQYMLTAIGKYGSLLGMFMGAKRLLRCGPWTSGGYDPVP